MCAYRGYEIHREENRTHREWYWAINITAPGYKLEGSTLDAIKRQIDRTLLKQEEC